MGITQVSTIEYRPEGNAPIESFHKTLNKYFATINGHIPLDEVLQLALYSYRATIHSTLLESPAFMVYGRDLVSPQDNDWRFYADSGTQERIKFINQLRRDIFEKAHVAYKYAHAQATEINLEIGSLVLVRSRPPDISQHIMRTPQALKLVPKWSLPARVERLSENKQRVDIKFILTGRTRTVHISEILKLNHPLDDHQKKMWEEAQMEVDDSDLKEVIRPQAKRLRSSGD